MRAALIIALGLSTACATTQASKTALEKLQEAIEAYNHAFRWKNYERAAMFLPNDKRSAYLAAYEDDESSLQVEEFAIRNLDMLNDKGAKVSIRVSYLLLPSVTVEHRTMVQHWAEVNGSWVLEAEDNAIRSLDPKKQPRDPRARKPENWEADPDKTGHTEVDTFGPGEPDDEDSDPPR